MYRRQIPWMSSPREVCELGSSFSVVSRLKPDPALRTRCSISNHLCCSLPGELDRIQLHKCIWRAVQGIQL